MVFYTLLPGANYEARFPKRRLGKCQFGRNDTGNVLFSSVDL